MPPDADRDDQGFVPFRGDDRLMNFIGGIGLRTGDGRATLRVSLHDGALNPLGMLHGGALSALCDVAMYEVAKAGGEALTVAQEVKFLRPATASAPLFVEAEALRAGRSAVFCSARAMQDGRLCAFSTAQFARAGRRDA